MFIQNDLGKRIEKDEKFILKRYKRKPVTLSKDIVICNIDAGKWVLSSETEYSENVEKYLKNIVVGKPAIKGTVKEIEQKEIESKHKDFHIDIPMAASLKYHIVRAGSIADALQTLVDKGIIKVKEA